MREPEDPIMLHMLHYILANEGGRGRVDRGSIILDAAREFPDVSIGKVFTKYASHPRIEEFIEYLSLPIATEINIFDPDYVVLGGGILQMEDFPIDTLEKYIVRHSRKPYPAENLVLLYSEMAQENGVIGAGIYGFSARERANKDSAYQQRRA